MRDEVLGGSQHAGAQRWIIVRHSSFSSLQPLTTTINHLSLITRPASTRTQPQSPGTRLGSIQLLPLSNHRWIVPEVEWLGSEGGSRGLAGFPGRSSFVIRWRSASSWSRLDSSFGTSGWSQVLRGFGSRVCTNRLSFGRQNLSTFSTTRMLPPMPKAKLGPSALSMNNSLRSRLPTEDDASWYTCTIRRSELIVFWT